MPELSLVRICCVIAHLKGTFLGFPLQRSSQRIQNLVVYSTEVLVFNAEYLLLFPHIPKSKKSLVVVLNQEQFYTPTLTADIW